MTPVKYSFCTLVFLFASLASYSHTAMAFSFSGHEAREAREETRLQQSRAQRVAELMSIPCRSSLKNVKTAVIIAEKQDEHGWETRQENFGALFDAINQRLRSAGIRTYNRKEITEQIAREEMQAYLSNDPDRAAAAAGKLQADFVLRGTISSQIRRNPVVNVNELFVTMVFTLFDADGKRVTSVTERADSFAGADTLGVALKLVRERADIVVATLYNGVCRERRGGAPSASDAAENSNVSRAVPGKKEATEINNF